MNRTAISTKPRARKCPICLTSFVKQRPLQVVCSLECSVLKVRVDRDKVERKEVAVRKQALKTRSDWLKEAQQAVNAWIRARDADQPCISCGRHHDGQYHAGHYVNVGAQPALRFIEDNISKQCAPCNDHLAGNKVLYRKALIQKIGLARVEWLEGPHEARKHTVEELEAIKRLYKAKLKQLQQERE